MYAQVTEKQSDGMANASRRVNSWLIPSSTVNPAQVCVLLGPAATWLIHSRLRNLEKE